MQERDAIVRTLDEYFDVENISDYGPQGLQVEGAPMVESVLTAVSCSLELFERAADKGAQMIVVHHGLIWDRDSRRISGVKRRRLKVLFDNDISLLAYHLPLDAHPVIGHSALIAKDLSLVDRKPFASCKNIYLGVQGRLSEGLSASALAEEVEQICGREALVLGSEKKKIETVAIVSGGGASSLSQAIAEGIDCLISGEAKEETQALCRESSTVFIEAGHYNSEKPGILALGKMMTERFGLEVEFIDLPNPV